MDKQKRVLVVDDDDQIAKMYITHLDFMGFITKRVSNGEDALATTLEFKPDIMLLDVMMPKINGFDVLDIIRNTPQTSDLPVIMLSALSGSDDIERAKKLGVNEFLEKSSTDLPTIVKVINDTLRE
jgi:CheY-like chemotaxis protein